MQKNENPILLAVILCIITGVIALLLAFSNIMTKDIILENSQKEQQIAKQEVIKASTYTDLSYTPKGIVKTIYEARNEENSVIGYCVNVSPGGFGGEINMMVGIDIDNKITGIKIISMSETAGLGSKAQNPDFTNQFKGKESHSENILGIIKSGSPKSNEIVAISGATITSNAIRDGVTAACDVVNEITKEAVQ